jgi:hypothetical protein
VKDSGITIIPPPGLRPISAKVIWISAASLMRLPSVRPQATEQSTQTVSKYMTGQKGLPLTKAFELLHQERAEGWHAPGDRVAKPMPIRSSANRGSLRRRGGWAID